MVMSEKWACRFCKQKLELQPTDRQRFCHQLPNPEPHELWVTWTICPNINCRKPVLTAKLFTTRDRPTDGKSAHQPVDYWTSYAGRDLYPLPPPVPELLREDYVEARKILNLSPTASVMLARRCLERVLRDKWNSKGTNLAAQIAEVKGKIDRDLWETLESARKIANRCAHAHPSVSDEPNVTPEEAARLLELLKSIFEEWYTAYEKKEKLYKAVKAIAKKQEGLKKAA